MQLNKTLGTPLRNKLLSKDLRHGKQIITAILKAEEFCDKEPEEAAKISSKYIGISAGIVREALRYNQPHIDITGSIDVMMRIVKLMKELGYIQKISQEFYNFELLKKSKAELE